MKFLNRHDDVATAYEPESVPGRHGIRDGLRARMEGLKLEHAYRAVPDDRTSLAGDGDQVASAFSSFSDKVSVRKWRTGSPRLNDSFDLAQSKGRVQPEPRPTNRRSLPA